MLFNTNYKNIKSANFRSPLLPFDFPSHCSFPLSRGLHHHDSHKIVQSSSKKLFEKMASISARICWKFSTKAALHRVFASNLTPSIWGFCHILGREIGQWHLRLQTPHPLPCFSRQGPEPLPAPPSTLISSPFLHADADQVFFFSHINCFVTSDSTSYSFEWLTLHVKKPKPHLIRHLKI